MRSINAEELAVGDVLVAIADAKFSSVSGQGVQVLQVEKRRNIPDPGRNTYTEEHDKVYVTISREGTEHQLWFLPEHQLTVL